GYSVMEIGKPGAQHLMWPFKRAFDLLVSSVVLVLTSPVLLLCALAVKLTSRGPILFRQVRVSVDNIPFEILKFRTMRYVADADLQEALDHRAQAVALDDDRITPVGRLLRRTHLDELPQLVNVLKGDMSIVGPRPERPYFVDLHEAEVNGYALRHRVPAGITGWAQVHGYWGDTSIEARIRLDNRYIESWSPWRDLVIGLRTIPTLLGRRR
ncbi:MAG: sugar transferase, partial [Microthrixaceae bacterium]